MKYVFAAIALLVALPASAQTGRQNSTTECTTVAGYTRCDTRSSGLQPPIDYYGILSRGDEERAQKQKAEQTEQRRKAVAAQLAVGNCDGAIRIALAAGDVELAATAKRFCAGK